MKKLHKDEAGLKTLETVAILAIAAIILAVIKIFWGKIYSWFDNSQKDTTKDWKDGQDLQGK